MNRSPANPLTIERVERGMLLLARVIEMDGDVYLPLFASMESALADLKRAQATRDRARAYLDANRYRLIEGNDKNGRPT
ncbi:hypothetical protein [Rhodopseudomonas sp. RCAM05734]|uniref:hypothetical protein n=1 Tax=Rhodopseudomonas sp. RCAM05734 TaxID=3457549 RepID=UPI004043B3DF